MLMSVKIVHNQIPSIINLTGQRQFKRQEDIRKIVRTPAAFVDSRPFRLYKRLVDNEMEENFEELIIDGEIIKSVVRCKQCYILLAKPNSIKSPITEPFGNSELSNAKRKLGKEMQNRFSASLTCYLDNTDYFKPMALFRAVSRQSFKKPNGPFQGHT